MFNGNQTMLAAAMVLACVLYPAAARADHMPEATAALVDVAVVLPGLALSIPNVVHIVEGRRPPIGWLVTGLSLGVVGAGLSTLILASERRQDSPSLAIAGVAASALSIVFACWAWAQPAGYEETPRMTTGLTISPLILGFVGSRPTYGVAISGVRF